MEYIIVSVLKDKRCTLLKKNRIPNTGPRKGRTLGPLIERTMSALDKIIRDEEI